MAKVGKSKQKMTNEGKEMLKFWRGMAKCKPVQPTFKKDKEKK